MNKDEEIMFFLGQIKARIEEINRYATLHSSNRITDILTDLESFFNQGFNGIVKLHEEASDKPKTVSGRMEIIWT